MAKVPFTKLGLIKDNKIETIEINGQIIEIKQYLPIQEKLELVSRIINNSSDDNNFQNPMKLDLFTCLEVIYAYTNISFTEKQKEDAPKLYDLMDSNDIFNIVISKIPQSEYKFIVNGVNETAKAIYAYNNSVMGILENVTRDYSNLDVEATDIYKKISDPTNLAFLKDVLTKLG